MAGLGRDAVLKQLETLGEVLTQEPPTDFTAKVHHHCERLDQAIRLSHAEGIRFAAFTLMRMSEKAGPELRSDTRAALQQLKSAIEASALPH